MEKIALLSDIHGNITALNEVLNDIENRGIKRIFCLGDYITKCSHPDLVIDRLREVAEVMIKGNCDNAICKPENKNKNFYSRKIIGEERAQFLFNLPISHDFYMSGHLIRIFHACPYNLDGIYNPMFSNEGTVYSGNELKDPEDLFKNTEFIGKSMNEPEPDIVVYGHIHTPCIVRYKNKTLINAGSVGIPIEMCNSDIDDEKNKFSTLASYAIIEGTYGSKELGSISFNLVRVPYDIKKEVKDLEYSETPNKHIIIKSLKGAIPPEFNFRSGK